MFRLGIVGATGYIGVPYRQEIRAASQQAQVIGLCARRQDRLEAAAREDRATVFSAQWRDVVERDDVDLVLVLTPDALHFEPAMTAIRLGKHLLCEKPVGKDAEEARQLWAAAQAANIASFVPFWTRYALPFQRAKAHLDEGKVGEVRAVIYRWHNPRPVDMPFTWRDDASLSSAGSIADVGSHAYDTLRYLLGTEATEVHAHAEVVMPAKRDAGAIDLSEALAWDSQDTDAQARKRGSTPDYAQLSLKFGPNLVGSVLLSHASYLRKGFAPELEIHGTLGSLAVDRVRGELWFADSPEPARLLEKVQDAGDTNRFERYVFPALAAQIAGEAHDHPTLTDGYQVQRFTDAALQSAQQRQWIPLEAL